MAQAVRIDQESLEAFTPEELEEARQYSLLISWSPEDGVYLAECPELPPARTHGRTHEEALAMGEEVIAYYLWHLRQEGRPVPPPRFAVAAD